MSEETVETPTPAVESAPVEVVEEPVALIEVESFRDAPDSATSICSGAGEETNTDIWTQ